MSKRDRILPPGPNPREDLRKEKDQKQLRETMRAHASDEGEPGERGEMEAADQAEGERSGEPAKKVKHTPDQAEGEREGVEEEIRSEEEKRHL